MEEDLKCAPRLPGCGTQHPHRALGGTRVLLAAAPTTPPCFRRWRRSSLLQRKNYFKFWGTETPAGVSVPFFHGWGEPLSSCRFASSHLPQGDGFSGGGKLCDSAERRLLEGRLPPLRGKMSPQVTKRGICRAATEGVLFVPNSTFWGENRKRLSKVHKKAAQSLAGADLTVPGRILLRNNRTN